VSWTLQEHGVPKTAVGEKKWTKPEMKRIGQIKDVAGPNGFGPQGAHNRS
jgi:hypothetical protein